MTDPFVGTWHLNVGRSKFDAHHQPPNGTMTVERDSDGAYHMRAHMTKENSEVLAERPQHLIPDGKPHAVPDFHGLSAVTTKPNPHTLVSQVRRQDGSLVGEGQYVVSDDGRTLTATTSGFDTQLRQFKIETAWDRA
jgi:hypothetical protein